MDVRCWFLALRNERLISGRDLLPANRLVKKFCSLLPGTESEDKYVLTKIRLMNGNFKFHISSNNLTVDTYHLQHLRTDYIYNTETQCLQDLVLVSIATATIVQEERETCH
jgi:hypothetical protein